MRSAFVQPLPLSTRSVHRAISPLRPRTTVPRAAMGPIDWLQSLIRPTTSMATTPIAPPTKHTVLGNPVAPPPGGWQAPLQEAMFGLGWYVML